jgi:hypothetical protein
MTTMALVQVILDVLVAGLLIATIVYSVGLNRKLAGLRRSRSELQDIVRGFAEASARAEAGVRGMKKMAGESADALQRTIERAGALRDELEIMIDSGNSLAGRLEGSATLLKSRAAASAAAASVRPDFAGTGHGAAVESDQAGVETDGGAALSGFLSEKDAPRSAALRNFLRQAAFRAESEGAPAAAVPRAEAGRPRPLAALPTDMAAGTDARSRAERELIQAIENMR